MVHQRDNAGEYMSRVTEQILRKMDITDVPIIAQNQEENGVAECYNVAIMNAVWTAHNKAKMDR